jgi:two-component system, NtrC family, response regulator AtoC
MVLRAPAVVPSSVSTRKPPTVGDGDRTFELATYRGEVETRPVVSLLWDGGTSMVPLPDRDPCVIGRASDAELTIDARSVSRRHALLHHTGGLAIEDLGSANGTRVRGRRLAPGERVSIEPYEPVMIGSAVLVVRPSGASAPAEAAVKGEARVRPPTVAPPAPTGEARGGPPTDEVELLVSLVAPTDLSVLLLGETGVGKGYFARVIHDRSRRASRPFVHLNCAALPENLLESELFGYERGAFSGAVQAKPGLFESAEHGTVFLDEVGELPAAVQAKLLVAIERREVLRVGGLKPRPIDVRFISATNRPNSEQSIVGLRPDLYFRLAGLPISIPPLRERKGEIPALAEAFARDAAKRLGRGSPTLTPSAIAALTRYDWPGNVRELASVLDRAMLFATDALVETDLRLPTAPPSRRAPDARADPGGAPAPPPSAAAPAAQPPTPAVAPSRTLAAEYQELERRRIVEALDACGGNQSRAATVLGISRKTLVTRIAEFGLPRPRKR